MNDPCVRGAQTGTSLDHGSVEERIHKELTDVSATSTCWFFRFVKELRL
ncbi:MAG TPA: hypothetical protein VEB88_01540 [Candidatus Acidoferrales bacterium]|nr:hypothetical protein [Candidatus Acidoferrales bacterium]